MSTKHRDRSASQKFRISLGHSIFLVSKTALSTKSQLFNRNPGLSKDYHVRSDVPAEILGQFLDALEGLDELPITAANVTQILTLSQEFGVNDFVHQCEHFQASATTVPSYLPAIIIVAIIFFLFIIFWRVVAVRLHRTVQCPFHPSDPLNGIINYLTRKCGGNVHDKSVVTITSKSVCWGYELSYAPRNVANLRSESAFISEQSENEWIRWDFHRRRIRPTHYTMKFRSWRDALGEWMLESSLDDANWTEIDRFANDKKSPSTIQTRPVANMPECRFVRLTLLNISKSGSSNIQLMAFELFGTLTEPLA
jgi:hypothetical protein